MGSSTCRSISLLELAVHSKARLALTRLHKLLTWKELKTLKDEDDDDEEEAEEEEEEQQQQQQQNKQALSVLRYERERERHTHTHTQYTVMAKSMLTNKIPTVTCLGGGKSVDDFDSLFWKFLLRPVFRFSATFTPTTFIITQTPPPQPPTPPLPNHQPSPHHATHDQD